MFSRCVRARGGGETMKLLYRRCAGLDVHEKSVSVCARLVQRGKPVEMRLSI